MKPELAVALFMMFHMDDIEEIKLSIKATMQYNKVDSYDDALKCAAYHFARIAEEVGVPKDELEDWLRPRFEDFADFIGIELKTISIDVAAPLSTDTQ